MSLAAAVIGSFGVASALIAKVDSISI